MNSNGIFLGIVLLISVFGANSAFGSHACPAPVIPESGYYGISKSVSGSISNRIGNYDLSDSESHKEFIEASAKLYDSSIDSIIKARDELVNDCHYRLESLQDIDPLVKEVIHYKEHGEFKFYVGTEKAVNSEAIGLKFGNYVCKASVEEELKNHSTLHDHIQASVDRVKNLHGEVVAQEHYDGILQNDPVGHAYTASKLCLGSMGYDTSKLPAVVVPEFGLLSMIVLAGGTACVIYFCKTRFR